MNPIVFTPWACMCLNRGPAMMESFAAVLNIQRRLSSTGSVTDFVAELQTTGVLAAATISSSARHCCAVADPMIASTCSSSTNLRVLTTVRVVSVPSSRTMNCTSTSPTFVGARLSALREPIPSVAAGPESGSVMPILT